jgi:hypothetical protein
MAKALHAFIDPDRMPARDALQAAIGKLGFGLKLDGDWLPFDSQGYLPCTLQGEDAGADVRFEHDAPWPDSAAANQGAQGARSAGVLLRWGGDRREELAATILAAALVEGFDAVVIEPERGVRKSLSGLKAHARELHEGTF